MSAANGLSTGQAVSVADSSFARDVAAHLAANRSLESLAAKLSMPMDEMLVKIEANESAINCEVAEMESDGRSVQLSSLKILDTAVQKLGGEVEAGNLNHAMLLRTVEILNKVSGLEAKSKQAVPEGSKFSITIVLPGQEIVLGNPKQWDIEGEAKEVVDVE